MKVIKINSIKDIDDFVEVQQLEIHYHLVMAKGWLVQEQYLFNRQSHRLDGPAVLHKDRPPVWYIHGVIWNT